MKYIKKLKNELTPSRWKGGSTSELFIYPENSCYQGRDFEIRVSSATVEESPSVFTVLQGYHRVLMPLNSPLKLVFAGQEVGATERENGQSGQGGQESQGGQSEHGGQESQDGQGGQESQGGQSGQGDKKTADGDGQERTGKQTDKQKEIVINPFQSAEFDGGWQTTSHGLCTDVGIMLASGWEGRLYAAQSGIFECPQGFVCVYSLANGVKIDAGYKRHILESGDFIIFETSAGEEIKLDLSGKNAAVVAVIAKK